MHLPPITIKRARREHYLYGSQRRREQYLREAEIEAAWKSKLAEVRQSECKSRARKRKAGMRIQQRAAAQRNHRAELWRRGAARVEAANGQPSSQYQLSHFFSTTRPVQHSEKALLEPVRKTVASSVAQDSHAELNSQRELLLGGQSSARWGSGKANDDQAGRCVPSSSLESISVVLGRRPRRAKSRAIETEVAWAGCTMSDTGTRMAVTPEAARSDHHDFRDLSSSPPPEFSQLFVDRDLILSTAELLRLQEELEAELEEDMRNGMDGIGSDEVLEQQAAFHQELDELVNVNPEVQVVSADGDVGGKVEEGSAASKPHSCPEHTHWPTVDEFPMSDDCWNAICDLACEQGFDGNSDEEELWSDGWMFEPW